MTTTPPSHVEDGADGGSNDPYLNGNDEEEHTLEHAVNEYVHNARLAPIA